MSDEELIAIARAAAEMRGYPAELDATVAARTPQARVLLSDPAYARGGGLLVVVDPRTGAVVQVVPQL
jgi:hypothetical protein